MGTVSMAVGQNLLMLLRKQKAAKAQYDAAKISHRATYQKMRMYCAALRQAKTPMFCAHMEKKIEVLRIQTETERNRTLNRLREYLEFDEKIYELEQRFQIDRESYGKLTNEAPPLMLPAKFDDTDY